MENFDIDWEKFKQLSPDKQREITGRLARVNQAAKDNPLLFWTPHEKQHEFLNSRAHFKWFLGGNRAGKTECSVVDDIIQAVDRDVLPDHLQQYKRWEPPFQCRVVAANTDMLENFTIPKFQEKIPRNQLIDNDWSKSFSSSKMMLRLNNGSFIQFKTSMQEAWTHGGADLHRVHFDEEPDEAVFNENMYRLIDYDGDVLVSMTPVQGLDWMYDRFWVPHEKKKLKDAFVVLVDMDDNPNISAAGKRRALESSSIEEREARKTGKFVHFHGLVYSEFASDNIVETHDPPLDAPKYVGIDPGIRHPTGVCFFYHSEDDELVLYAELKLSDLSAEGVAEEIHKVNARFGAPDWYVIDPAGRNRQQVTGRSMQQELADQGIVAFAGQNDVRAGQNNVKVRLERSKLLIQAHCTETIREFRMHRWANPTRKSQDAPKEIVIKKNDDILDAIRYVCMARPMRLEEKVEVDPRDPLDKALDEMYGQRRRDNLENSLY